MKGKQKSEKIQRKCTKREECIYDSPYVSRYVFFVRDRVVCTLVFLSIQSIRSYYIRIVTAAFVISCFSGKCFNHACSDDYTSIHNNKTHTYTQTLCVCSFRSYVKRTTHVRNQRMWISMKCFFLLSLVDEGNKQKGFYLVESLNCARFLCVNFQRYKYVSVVII